MKNKLIMCKSLVANKIIKKNEKLTYDNVCVKRPGNGIPAKYLKNLLVEKQKNKLIMINLSKYEI